MDPFIPVPPLHYGGIERVIHDIARRYVQLGHSVTLVAGPNSLSPDRLVEYGANGPGSVRLDVPLLARVTSILAREIPRHDVVHNFGRLAFLFPIAWSGIRKVQTYMRWITPANIRALNGVGVRNITYTAVSDAIVNMGRPGGGEWQTVYNCAPVEQYTFVDRVAADAPLVFLGRLERCKGAHTAIDVARLANRRLIIAGNISQLPHEKAYFHKEVEPRIDGTQVQYIGVVNDTQKNALLGQAAALLLPIEWEEPFPVVLPEAYACGTPVLAFPRGGVPEGVTHGRTGLISTSAEEMAAQVPQLETISRAECRRVAMEAYSDASIARDYLEIYSRRALPPTA
jgi:glycosyltransferase involved in cell wall biosynthesis